MPARMDPKNRIATDTLCSDGLRKLPSAGGELQLKTRILHQITRDDRNSNLPAQNVDSKQ
jgi:hypothetical protein